MYLKIAEVAKANRGWNMRQVAEELKIEHQTVLYWNQGRAYPRLPTLVRLCRALHCTFEELLSDNQLLTDDEPEPSINYEPLRKKGHCPQIITAYRGGMGVF